MGVPLGGGVGVGLGGGGGVTVAVVVNVWLVERVLLDDESVAETR